MMSDLRIFRQGLKQHLLPFERVITDSGYQGDHKCKLPKEGNCKRQRKAMGSLRARHETINGRLKNWGCLNEVWRHHQDKHEIAFKAVLVITQIELIKRDPLFDVKFKDPFLE